MFDSLINHIRFTEKIRMNQVTYYITKIPILKYLIPKNPYAPETKKFLIYILSALSLIFGVLFKNGMMAGFYIGISILFYLSTYGRYLLPTFIVFGTLVFSMIKAFNTPSYITGSPMNYRSLMYHFRVEPKQISRNIRTEYFIRGFMNRLYLFILMPNMFFVVLGFGSWYVGILIMDSIHSYYFKKNERILLDQSNFNMKNGFIRATISMILVLMVVLPMMLPAVTQEYVHIKPINIGAIILVLVLLATYFDYKTRQNFDYKLMIRTYITGFAVSLGTIDAGQMVKEKNVSQVSKEYDKENVGKGFVMLNNIFFARYSKMWRKRSLINFSIIMVFTTVMIGMVIMNKTFGFEFDTNLGGMYGMVMLGMYYLNFGESITQALFYNCDSSLLGYRKYNTSENVLPNFIQRLKHIVRVHLPQSIVLSIGVVFLTKLIEPNTSVLLLGIVFIAFMSVSLLFCIHSLVTYYVFQPYTINLEMKGIGYTVMTMVAYIFAYSISSIGLDWITMVNIISVSSIIYLPVAALLVYTLAPTRFKVKR